MANLKELKLPSLHEKENAVEVAAENAANKLETVENKNLKVRKHKK